MIIRNFVWQNVGDGKCSSEGKGPQKTGGQGWSEGKGPHSFWIGPCSHVLASVLHRGRSVAWRTPLPATNLI